MRLSRLLPATAAAALAFGSAPANALVFNLINTGGAEAGTQARAGFELAAAYWSSVLTNNSTVNLEIGFESLGAGILGSTGSTRADVRLNTVVNALGATGNSALDSTALSNLRPLVQNGAVSAITNTDLVPGLGVDTGFIEWDNDRSENNRYIWGNTAVLKAMGLTTNEYTGASFANVVDGGITFSSDFAFDFDANDGITAGSYDFVGVAIHEIGHALGFVSGVDLYDVYGYPNGPAWPEGGFDFDNPGGGLMSTLDLFRYSSDIYGVAPGTGPVLDWSVATPETIAAGGEPYFSIDGGKTQLFGNSAFSSGDYNGDGGQASHWQAPGTCDNLLGIMNPYLCGGTSSIITGLDLAAFDAMGWNLSFDVLANPNYSLSTQQIAAAAVPEPATWAMMIVGFGMAGGALRRRRATTKVRYTSVA